MYFNTTPALYCGVKYRLRKIIVHLVYVMPNLNAIALLSQINIYYVGITRLQWYT